MAYLGLDVGTTRIKAVVYDAHRGRVVADAAAPTPVHDGALGPERSPTLVLDAVLAAATRALAAWRSASAGGDIDAIGLTSLSEEVFLLDERGAPAGPALTWFNPTGSDRTRLPDAPDVDPSFSVFTLRWLTDHLPDLPPTTRVTGLSGYLLARLGDDPADLTMDWAHASRSGTFDRLAKQWEDDAVRWAGLTRTMMPRLVPPGSRVGSLSADLARALGLTAGLPLVSAGHDHFCAAFACGTRSPGERFISAGTSEAQLILTTDAPVGVGFDWGCFVDGTSYYVHLNQLAGHHYRTWLELLGQDGREDELYRDMEAEAVGSGGILALVGPNERADVSMLSVGVGTSPATVMRALLEGLAIRARRSALVLEQAAGRRPTRTVAAGIPTRRPIWRELRQALDPGDLHVTAESEPAAVGAALLAQRCLTGAADEPVVLEAVPATSPGRAAAYARLVRDYDAAYAMGSRPGGPDRS